MKYKKASWQQQLKDNTEYWKNECLRKDAEITRLKSMVGLMEPHMKAPPTVMIACERLVDAAAHMCADALQLVREVKHI